MFQQKQNQTPGKKVKVSVRAGVGGKLSTHIPMSQIKNSSVSELCQHVVNDHLSSSDLVTRNTAHALEGILQDPSSDIDMRLFTSERIFTVPHNETGRDNVGSVIKDKGIQTEDDVEELELAASRIAKGG